MKEDEWEDVDLESEDDVEVIEEVSDEDDESKEESKGKTHSNSQGFEVINGSQA